MLHFAQNYKIQPSVFSQPERNTLSIEPPLLNSASPSATTLEDLRALYNCPSTGAVTTRTTLWSGSAHDDNIHRYTFFDPKTHEANKDDDDPRGGHSSSLNTLGYSPLAIKEYLSFFEEIAKDLSGSVKPNKPIIVSVTCTGDDLVDITRCYHQITETQVRSPAIPLAMEINLSCPNIPGKPPPAYEASPLKSYLDELARPAVSDSPIPIGLKLPPYTYAGQFENLIQVLLSTQRKTPISFLTATNTLGTSLLLADGEPVIGMGGMAGTALHPLALGNVYSLRKLLSQHEPLKDIQIIGVGGVEDGEGFKRMKYAGADAVAVATALGRKGLGVFKEISEGAGL